MKINEYISSKNLIKKITCFLCLLFAVIFTVTSFVSAVINFTFFNKSFYTNIVNDESYLTQVNNEIDEILEYESLYYGVPQNVLRSAVKDESVKLASHNFAVNFYDYLLNGKAINEKGFCLNEFKVVLTNYYTSAGEDNDFVNEVANNLSEETSGAVYSVAIEEILSPIKTIFFDNKIIRVFKSLYLVLFLVALSLFYGYFRLSLNNKKKFHNICSVFFCSSAIVFVPSLVFYLYKLSDRLVLSESAFSSFIFVAINNFSATLLSISSVLFIISLVLLILSVYLLCTDKILKLNFRR